MSDLIILRAGINFGDELNHGGMAYRPNPHDRLFAVPPYQAEHFLARGGCEGPIDPEEARAIVAARQQQELVALGLA
jgi:hypothetical protein